MYNLKTIINELMDIDDLEVLSTQGELVVSVVETGLILCTITKQKYMIYTKHYLYTGAINAIVNSNKAFDTREFIHDLRDEFEWKYEELVDSGWVIKNSNDDFIIKVDLPTIDTDWNGFIDLPLEQQHRVYQILEEHMRYED